jgi:hypothetical protein
MLDLMGPLDGDLCYKWEQSILQHIRSSGVLQPAQLGHFEGMTEAWSISQLSVTTIRELREMVWSAESLK